MYSNNPFYSKELKTKLTIYIMNIVRLLNYLPIVVQIKVIFKFDILPYQMLLSNWYTWKKDIWKIK